MIKRTVFIFFSLCSILFADVDGACHIPNPPTKAIPLIIDIDASLDDMMGLLYLLKSPAVDIKAITVTGDGMSSLKHGVPNILNLLQMAGHPNIPVAYGAKKSLSPAGNFPVTWMNFVNDVSGIILPKNPNPPSLLHAEDLIIKICKESKEKVVIFTSGPTTDVAMAIQKDPSIKDNIKSLFIIAGAINIKGDILNNRIFGYKNRVAEYNAALDALALNILFHSDIPILLIPINATNHVPITLSIFKKLRDNDRNLSEDFVMNVIRPEIGTPSGPKDYFYNPVGSVLLTDPGIGCYKNLKLAINLQKGPQYAQVFETPHGVLMKVCMSLNPYEFYAKYLSVLE